MAKERNALVRCQGVPLHAWSNDFFEQIAGSFGKFVSTDFSAMTMKRLDVARVLIRTSSWEAINRTIKVRINGVFFTIRILEESFPEFTFQSSRKEADNDSSSSSSVSLSLGNFSMGSELEGSFDFSEEEYELQNLFEDQGVGELNVDDGSRLVLSGKVGGNVPIIESSTALKTQASEPLEDGEIPNNGILYGQRELHVVDNSTDLVVDLRFSPLEKGVWAQS